MSDVYICNKAGIVILSLKVVLFNLTILVVQAMLLFVSRVLRSESWVPGMHHPAYSDPRRSLHICMYIMRMTLVTH